jgi:hypothetical protein
MHLEIGGLIIHVKEEIFVHYVPHLFIISQELGLFTMMMTIVVPFELNLVGFYQHYTLSAVLEDSASSMCGEMTVDIKRSIFSLLLLIS